MAKNRNKKINKIRRYRDKLLVRTTNLEGTIREHVGVFSLIRVALRDTDYIRAYALSALPEAAVKNNDVIMFRDKNEIIKELTLVYKMLAVERNYTYQISTAGFNRDLLRIAALSAEHKAEQIAHDKMLSRWSKDHGFTKSLKGAANEDVV